MEKFRAHIDESEARKISHISEKNQNVENAGMAFVKGANERNEFFGKINKQVRTNRAKYQQSQGRTDLGMNSVK